MATVVLIEDEVVLRELVERELTAVGHRVLAASDGQKGWDLLIQEVPDVILLDLMMPNMNGYEVLERLKEDEALKNVPCVVISNSGQVADLNRAFELGAADVLIKTDFDAKQLVEKIDLLLAKRAQKAS